MLCFRRLPAVVLALVTLSLPALAQSSNGYTYYRIAGPNTVDSTGATIPGSPNSSTAFRTDGSNIIFTARTGSNDGTLNCGSDWKIYITSILGGTPIPLVTPTTLFEPSAAGKTTSTVCNSPILSGPNAIYGASYFNASGKQRYGFFSLPIAGGVSSSILGTGDPVPGTTTTAIIVRSGATDTVNSPNTPVAVESVALPNGTFLFDANLNSDGSLYRLQYNSNGSLVGGAAETNTVCGTYTFGTPTPNVLTSDGNGLYAGITTFFGTAASATSFSNSRTGAYATTTPLATPCSSLIFDPYPTTGIVKLPGEPAATVANFTTPVATVGRAVALGATVYFGAYQAQSDNTYYYGIFQSNNGVISRLVSNYDTALGLSVNSTYCDGTPSRPYISPFVVGKGKYLVIYASQATQDCSTQAYTSHGGIYFYDTIAKTFTLAFPFGTGATATEPGFGTVSSWGSTEGTLTADGHLLIGNITAIDGNSTPLATILYSVYLAQQVTAVSLAVTPAASAYAGSVTLTAKVTPNTVAATSTAAAATAGGTVNFYDSATLIGTATIDATGTASFTISSLTAGTHTLTANYIGDPNFMGATSAPLLQPVTKAATTAALTLSPAVTTAQTGSGITLTGTLATQLGGTPTGSLSFYDGTQLLTTVPLTSMNNATYTTSALAAGPHTLTVAYIGDPNFLATTSTASALNITLPATVTATAASVIYGNPVVYTIAVTGTGTAPTGTIAYSVDSIANQTASLTAGAATISLPNLAAGTHKFTYLYSGDTTYTVPTTSSSATFTVTPAPLTVTVASATRAYGAANPTFSAPFTGLVYNDPITATTATNATTASAPGTYPITATLADPSSKLANYVVTNTPANLTVTKAADTLAVIIPATAGVGSAVSFTATLASATSGVPGGLVTFSTGQTTLGTATLLPTGTATLNIATLALGTYPITVSYPGDANFNAATSVNASITIGTPDYTIAVTPAAATLAAGQTATFAFSVTPVFGYGAPIAFSCSGLPANSTCTFSPSTVTPAGAPVNTNLTLATNVATAALSPAPLAQRTGVAIAFAAFFFAVPLLRRKLKTGLFSVLVAVALGGTLAALSGCTGSSNTGPKTPAGTYAITVMAGSGNAAHAATLNVTVTN